MRLCMYINSQDVNWIYKIKLILFWGFRGWCLIGEILNSYIQKEQNNAISIICIQKLIKKCVLIQVWSGQNFHANQIIISIVFSLKIFLDLWKTDRYLVSRVLFSISRQTKVNAYLYHVNGLVSYLLTLGKETIIAIKNIWSRLYVHGDVKEAHIL